jgi:hypothetical protein
MIQDAARDTGHVADKDQRADAGSHQLRAGRELTGMSSTETIIFARRPAIWLPNRNKTETLLAFRRRITTFGGDVRLFGRHALF